MTVERGNLMNLTFLNLSDDQLTGDITQELCNLFVSHYLIINQILNVNNLIHTCD